MNQDFYNIWHELTQALWDLTPKHPIIGMLCRKWAYQITSANQREIKPAATGSPQKTSFNLQSRGLTCDVVFVPNLDRSNYLGTSLELLEDFKKHNPDLTAGILTKGLSEKALRHLVLKEDWPLLSGPFFRESLVRHLPQAHQLTQLIEDRLQGHPELSAFLLQNRSEQFQRINSDMGKIGAYKHWLSAINCKCVITPNEQIEPASHLICAAKELGIETIQLLHGIPTKLYTPMLSDQLWVWDDAQADTFQSWGISANRLHVAGFMEPMSTLETSQAPASTGPKKNKKNIVVASQWQGALLWDLPHFEQVIRHIAQCDLPLSTTLQLRYHPQDTAYDKREITSLFESWKIPPSFIEPKKMALQEQLLHAHKVITASSTVGYMAGSLGIPTAILWDESLTELHGEPHFPHTTLIHDAAQLQTFINQEVTHT